MEQQEQQQQDQSADQTADQTSTESTESTETESTGSPESAKSTESADGADASASSTEPATFTPQDPVVDGQKSPVDPSGDPVPQPTLTTGSGDVMAAVQNVSLEAPAETENPDKVAHDKWVAERIADGWGWGPVYNPGDRRDPRLVNWEALKDAPDTPMPTA